MKTILFSFFTLLVSALSTFSQTPLSVDVKDGNVSVRYSNGEVKQISDKGTDLEATLSGNKAFVVIVRKTLNGQGSGNPVKKTELKTIVFHELRNQVEKTEVRGCNAENTGGSAITYANSTNFPFLCFSNLGNAMISKDNHRIYFEANRGDRNNSVHFIHIPTGNVYFFHQGSLLRLNPDGNLVIRTMSTLQDGTSYYQDKLFNKNGDVIQALGKKMKL